ncbi:Inositol-tetrakisphosphate 1-kinase 4 [Zea mays]|uniref:Inositol-tetrakisphosphate 1-kinase n=1 Tax=Zea mays TaxID=4577 RepID=A0A3L6EI99_MAIZE|nr:Inositol-tetrakisphosphate 1-kinase 4 [Zea mays]
MAAEQCQSSGGSSPRPRAAYTIGYAMLPNKHDTFVQPSFIDLAAQHGIRLVALDASRPLAEQGPQLDLVVHKLYGQAWRARLEAFSALHPDVPIIDPPAAIDRILDRFTMLDVVSGLDCVAVPRQVMVHDAGALQQAADAAAAADGDDVLGGLRFPLVAKPVEVDGSAASHDLCLVYRREGLRGLRGRPPLVLQEFANHGGVLFKVYVVGDRATCVVRSSLPDVPPERLRDPAAAAAAPFANISLLAPSDHDEGSEKVVPPPQDFVDRVAREIRRAVGLHLINFDLIRTRDDAAGGDANKYLVLDINYCPGYSKMPGFEPVLTEFFLERLRSRSRSIDERPAPGAEARQAEAEPEPEPSSATIPIPPGAEARPLAQA